MCSSQRLCIRMLEMRHQTNFTCSKAVHNPPRMGWQMRLAIGHRATNRETTKRQVSETTKTYAVNETVNYSIRTDKRASLVSKFAFRRCRHASAQPLPLHAACSILIAHQKPRPVRYRQSCTATALDSQQ